MTEKNDNQKDPFGFVDAINFDAINEMDGEQLEEILAILEKVK
tara:strand:+ start:213 stop:341 length:129 start_codon:yes stop_codon:yes gene_type:complete